MKNIVWHLAQVSKLVKRNADVALFVVGMINLAHGLEALANAQFVNYGFYNSFKQPNFNDSDIRGAVGLIFQLIEGAFGALIMVIAGLMAIIAAAMGNYKSALSMLLVAVGSFILRSMVSLFFGTNFVAPAAIPSIQSFH